MISRMRNIRVSAFDTCIRVLRAPTVFLWKPFCIPSKTNFKLTEEGIRVRKLLYYKLLRSIVGRYIMALKWKNEYCVRVLNWGKKKKKRKKKETPFCVRGNILNASSTQQKNSRCVNNRLHVALNLKMNTHVREEIRPSLSIIWFNRD